MLASEHQVAFRKKWEPVIDHASLQTGHSEFEPNPAASLRLPADRQHIVDLVTKNLYGGTPTEEACLKYARESCYDDPLSMCYTREQVSSQWYALPLCFRTVTVLAYEVVTNDTDKVVWKQKTEYTGIWGSKTITHVIVLVFAEEGETKIKYHKDLWSKDDYQHTGFGHAIKEFNAKTVPHILSFPDSLRD